MRSKRLSIYFLKAFFLFRRTKYDGDRITIFTLDARDNVMWAVMNEYFSLTPEQLHGEIKSAFSNLESVLRAKGIDYVKLKSALVPNIDKREIILVFDTKKIDSSQYGHQIFERIIPAFSPESNHSVLVGDYIGNINNQNILRKWLDKSITRVHNYDYVQSSQFFFVYINNMTKAMIQNFVQELDKYEPGTV